MGVPMALPEGQVVTWTLSDFNCSEWVPPSRSPALWVPIGGPEIQPGEAAGKRVSFDVVISWKHQHSNFSFRYTMSQNIPFSKKHMWICHSSLKRQISPKAHCGRYECARE